MEGDDGVAYFADLYDLETLEAQLGEVTREFLVKLSSIWVDSTAEIFAELEQAIQQQDKAWQVQQLTHRFIGSCKLLGFHALSAQGAHLHESYVRDEPAVCAAHFADLRGAAESQSERIRQCLAQSEEASSSTAQAAVGLEVVFAPNFEEMRHALQQTVAWLEEVGIEASARLKFEICCSEALTNIVRHNDIPAGRVHWCVRREEAHIHGEALFEGAAIPAEVFDPSVQKKALEQSNASLAENKRGGFILQEWLAEYSCHREGGINRIVLRFRL